MTTKKTFKLIIKLRLQLAHLHLWFYMLIFWYSDTYYVIYWNNNNREQGKDFKLENVKSIVKVKQQLLLLLLWTDSRNYHRTQPIWHTLTGSLEKLYEAKICFAKFRRAFVFLWKWIIEMRNRHPPPIISEYTESW